MSRHWSVRNHRSYLPLDSSDTRLVASECPENARCSAHDVARTEEEDVATQRDRNTRKRRWFHHLRRRKKRQGDGEAVEQRAGRRDDDDASRCDGLEVAVEASLNNCVLEPGAAHVVEHGSLLTLPRAARNNVELDIQALDLATTINKSAFYHHHHHRHHRRHTGEEELASRATRRFAICEELEREMIMEDGVNLRKSRKNLVIRQVLHDLLLL